jgi:Leucine-rich repeat (LRR) protein
MRTLFLGLCVMILSFGEAKAVPYYWRTGAPDLNWQNAANWSTTGHASGVNVGTFPGAADEAILGAPTPNLTLTNFPVGGVGILTATLYGNTLTIPSGQTLLIVGAGPSSISGTCVVDVQTGALLRIGNGVTINSGAANRIRITGILEIIGNTSSLTGGAIQYNAGGKLLYSGSGNRTTNGIELPTPMNGMVEINKALATETVTLGGGSSISALTITQGVFDLGGFITTLSANSSIAPSGTLTVNAQLRLNAGITLANGGGLINVVAPSGQIHIDGNAAITGTSPVYASGTTLLYWGTVAKIVGAEFPNPMNGTVVVTNTSAGGVTLNTGAVGTTYILNGAMTIGVNAMFIINPTIGAYSYFRYTNVGGITVAGTLRIQETLDLEAGAMTSFVNVNAGGKIQVQGQASASSQSPATQSIIYAGATSILEFVTSAMSTASFGTVGTNHLVPATMPGSILHSGASNLVMNGGSRIFNGNFTRTGTGFLTFDATTNLTFNNSNIDWGTGTQINASHISAFMFITGAGTINGTLTGLGTVQMLGLTMNRSGATLTLGSSFTFDAGALTVNNNGTVAVTGVGTVLTSGLGANTVDVGATLNIGAGATFRVRSGTALTNNGTVIVSNAGAGGILECEGDNNPNTRMTGTGTYSYPGTAAKLNYTGGTASMVWEAGPEFPSPMAGTVNVIKPGNSTVYITSTKSMTGPMIVQSGFLAVLTATGNLTLGGGSQVWNGAALQALNGTTVGGGANLTVQTGGRLQFVNTPKATWTGAPTYQTNSVLEYFNGTFSTGVELPSPMPGNIVINNSGTVVNLGANTVLNGRLLLSATPNNGTFTVPTATMLTLANAVNTIGAGATLNSNNPTGEIRITGSLANSGTVNIAGILTLSGAGTYTGTSPAPFTGTLQYLNKTPATYTTANEFPGTIGNLIVNSAAAGDVIILQNAKTVSGNTTITQGILQTSAVGTSLGHTIAGNLTVSSANSRLRVQENSSIGVGGTTSYSVAGATLEYAGTTLKTPTGGELVSPFGGSILLNNSGHVDAPASLIHLNTATASFNLTAGRWRIPAGGELRLDNGVSLLNGGAASYIETTPSANGNDARFTRNLNTAANWHLGSGGVYRLVATGMPSVATDISLGYANVSPTGTSDNAPFIGSATSPAYWYGLANPAATMTMTLNHPAITATSKVGSYSGANAAGAYSDVPAVSGVGTTNITPAISFAPATVRHLAIGTGPVATSDIVAATAPVYTYTSPINIAQYNAAANLGANVTATSISLFEFDVRDLGGDGLPTTMTDLNFTLNDIGGNLQRIALYDGATEVQEINAVNGALAFTGLAVNIANNTTKRLALRVTFKSNVTDNSSIGFTINSATASGAGSTFSAFAPLVSSVAGNNNRINVVATTLTFPNAVGNQVVNTNFTPAVDVRAVDVNNNLDVDAAGTMTLTGAPIAVSAGGSVVVTAGIGSFNAVQMAGTGVGNTLTATLGALSGVSANFTVTTIPVYWGCTIPSTPPPLPVLGIGGRDMNFNSVTLNGGGNSLTVNPNAPITIAGNWVMNWGGSPYCPGCVVQMYIGIGGGSGISGDGSSPTGFTHCIGSGVFNGSSGSFSYPFTAPSKPGIYYITQNWSLHYYCNPHPITFNNDPTYAIAVIRVIDPVPPSQGCNEADIIQTPGFIYQTNIPYSTYTVPMSGTHPAVWGFRIRDFGTIPTLGDIDNKPTQITSIGINVTDANGILQEIALYNGTGLIETQPVSGTGLVTFSSAAVANNLIAPDDGFIDIIVRARYRTSAITPPMDNQNVTFTINQANVTMAAAAVSTQKATFAVVGPSSVAGNNNRIEVTATQLAFQAQPPVSTPVGVPMASAVTVQAQDGNNNIDLDYVAPNIAIAHPNLIGSPVSVAPVAGLATFPLFSFNNLVAAGTLTASSGVLTAGISNAFDVIAATFHFRLATGDANLTTNWQLAGFPLISPAAVGLPGATYIFGSSAQDPVAANITAPLTINAGSTFQVSGSAGGSTLNVLAGQTLTNDGTLNIQGGGRLQLHDNGSIAPASVNPVTYLAATSTLEYTGGVIANRTTNDREFPTMFAGNLVVSRTAGAANFLLDGSKTIAGTFSKNAAGGMVINGVQVLTLNGASIVAAGTFNFLNTAQLIANNNFTYSGGTMLGDNSASISFNGTFTGSGGAITLNNAATLTYNAATTFNGTTLTSNSTGAITVGAGGSFTLNSGAVTLANIGSFTCNGAFANPSGNINVGNSTMILNGASTFGGGGINSGIMGTVRIIGTGALGGTYNNIAPSYGMFELNRAGETLSLAPGNLITANLTLTNGIIRPQAANRVEVTGTLTAMGGAGTYIDGKLRWQLSGGAITPPNIFTFPVGKTGNYLPFSYIDMTANNVQMEVEAMLPGSGGMNGPLFSSISTTEYWNVQQISATSFTDTRIRLGRATPMIQAAAVVGRSATQTGSYSGLGGGVGGGTVTSNMPDVVGSGFYAIGSLPSVFFYISGAAETPANWNSDIAGMGAPAIDFTSPGTTFIVPNGRNAAFTSNSIFGTVNLIINGGGKITVQNGHTLTVNTVFRIAAGGQLVLVDSAKVFVPSRINYLDPTAELVYDTPSPNRITTLNEFGRDISTNTILMQGSVRVKNGTVRLDSSAAFKNFTILGALALQNSTLDFGKDSVRLRLEGAISFNPSSFKTNATHALTIAGTGAITDSGGINFSTNEIGWLSMQRPNVNLRLGDSLLVRSQLSLLGGSITPPTGRALVLTNPADTALAGGSFSSMIIGTFARALPPNLTPTDSRSHFYPIGKNGTYLPLTLLNATTGSIAPIVAAEAFNTGAGGSVALGVSGALSPSEHWRVQTISGAFIGAQVGLMRLVFPFSGTHSLVASPTKTGLYSGLSSAITPIAQGTSLVGESVRIAGERFFSTATPVPGTPRITGFTPSVGGEQTVMTITGTNLLGVSAVAIGGFAVAQFSVVNSTTITVNVGAVASGPVQIGSPNGGAASHSTFTFVPSPVITNVLPNPAGLGTPITINGANFGGTTFLSIGGVQIGSNRFTVSMDGTNIVTTVPLNVANPIVTVATFGGTAISTNALVLLPPPQILSFTPAEASTGQVVTIFGQNFVGVRSVRVGSSNAQFSVNSPTRISLTIPPRVTTSATRVLISVIASAGSTTSATLFAYSEFFNNGNTVDPLRQTAIIGILDRITSLGGRVRVTGTNLELIQEIRLTTSIATTTASWSLSSSAALTLIIPTTGLLNGTNATLSSAATTMDVLGAFNRIIVRDAFRVVGVPRILSVMPIDANPGEEITLTGTGLDLITAVNIGGTNATFRIIDSSRVVVIMPFRIGADSVRIPASGPLTVTSPGGGTTTVPGVINEAIAAGKPVITNFSPTTGPPGTEIVITGLNFNAARDVSVVGIPVASFVINSPTRITAVLSTTASQRSQGPITLQTQLGNVDSRTNFTFTASLESDLNAANQIVAALGGDPSKLEILTENNRVVSVRAVNVGLRGALPPIISTLTEIRVLDLSNNFLTGEIPMSLSALRKLERINLSNNLFTGNLPSGVFCSFNNLRFMDVSRNNLTGEIPVCIANLNLIETLNLGYNRFTSLLPWQLGAMVSLTELHVNNNQLTGTLPPEIGTGGVRVTQKTTARLTRTPIVEVIDVSNNAFSGSIPPEWGDIPNLRVLRAENAGLTGRLPESIRNWSGISVLRLAGNRLSGAIPQFTASNLKELTLDRNRFTGALPASLGQASGLEILTAVGNSLTSIPSIRASRLDTVRLDTNRLEFSSLESFARAKVFSAQGQDSIKGSDDIEATLGETVQIQSGIGGASTRYQWFQNGFTVRGATGSTLTIRSLTPQSVGMYVCRATNLLLPNLTLVSSAIRVSLTGATQSLATPQLQFPTNLANNIAPRPQLRWGRVPLADSYTIVIARDAALRQDVQSAVVAQPELGDSVVFAWASAANRGVLLERGSRYFWAVRAATSLPDLIPAWSDTLSFTVVPFGQDIAFSSVNLGRVTIGDSARATGTIVNIGDDAVTVESAQVESGMERVFALSLQRSLLPKDATATFDVVFKPNRVDTLRANVQVRYSDARGQGGRTITIDRALVGRGSALAIETLNFDTVRIGKSSIQSVRIVNRSNRSVTVRNPRIIMPRGLTENVFTIASNRDSFTIDSGGVDYIPIRCLSLTRGLKVVTLELEENGDKRQSDIQAFARLERPDDASVSILARAVPETATPGAAVNVELQLQEYSTAIAQNLLSAAQPNLLLTLRFDRQVLVPDGSANGARLQRGTADSASVVVIANRWDGRSRLLAAIPFRAVAGSRTVSKLEVIGTQWGTPPDSLRPEWERKVFIEEPRSAVGTFTTRVSNAGGRRLIAANQPQTSTLATLSLVRPNPASDVIAITYSLLQNNLPTALDILNLKGELVQTLISEKVADEGEYPLSTSIRALPTGSYIVRLRVGSSVLTQRLDIVR